MGVEGQQIVSKGSRNQLAYHECVSVCLLGIFSEMFKLCKRSPIRFSAQNERKFNFCIFQWSYMIHHYGITWKASIFPAEAQGSTISKPSCRLSGIRPWLRSVLEWELRTKIGLSQSIWRPARCIRYFPLIRIANIIGLKCLEKGSGSSGFTAAFVQQRGF